MSFRLSTQKKVSFKNIETIFHGYHQIMVQFPVGDLNRSPTVGDIIKDWFFYFYNKNEQCYHQINEEHRSYYNLSTL